jgi:Protein of unknown function (DUF2752)
MGAVGRVASVEVVPNPEPSSVANDLRVLGAVMVAGAGLLPAVPDVGPLCPLRRVTGVPCPFCGMTTGVLALSRGDVVSAFVANPVAPLLVVAVVISFLPFVYRSGPFRWATARATAGTNGLVRLGPWLLLPVLWLWELHRFDQI